MAYKGFICKLALSKVLLKVRCSKLFICMLSSMRASSPGHSGGWAGKGRRAGNYVSGIWIPPPFLPSTELSDFRQSLQRGSECGCKQTLKNMWKHAPRVETLVMSSPPINILHWLFQRRYSNSRDVVAISPSFPHTPPPPTPSPPAECPESLLTSYMFSSQAFDSLRKQTFLLAHRHWGTFRKEERLGLSDRNSILMM